MTQEQIDKRAERCRRIAASGGHATYEKYGKWHMKTIGSTGAKVTIERHGVAFFQGMMERKGRRYTSKNQRITATKDKHSLARDLRAGMILSGWYEQPH
jgi:hypothetical protein